MDLKGQRVIIMGGTSGIGLAAAKDALKAGASVVIAGRDEVKLKTAISELPEGAEGAVVDAVSINGINGFFDKCGIFDHLVLSLSGKSGGGPFASLKAEQLKQGFESKFFAYFNSMQACLKTIRPGGSIVIVTASSARTSFPGTSGLAAINGALESMIPTLALELKPVRVNAVSPGIIDTPWWNVYPEEQKKAVFSKIASDTPVGRIGRSEDVAHAIMFLLENTFTTGIVLECDGGIRLK